MRQKSGKRSAADLDITTTEPLDLRLEPPAFLSATEAALFREVLLNVPAGHFARADQYLLATFCQVTMLCRQTAKAATKANAKDAPTRFKMLFEAVKTQALIATKLRLTVQS